eukprot:3691848-Amphidinium_carterae.2
MVNAKTELTDKDALLRLWVHEANRQFRDRLAVQEDRTWFDEQLISEIYEHLEEEWTTARLSSISYSDILSVGDKQYTE